MLLLGSATVMLRACTLSFEVAGVLHLHFSGPATLLVTGSVLLALIFYCTARIAFLVKPWVFRFRVRLLPQQQASSSFFFLQ